MHFLVRLKLHPWYGDGGSIELHGKEMDEYHVVRSWVNMAFWCDLHSSVGQKDTLMDAVICVVYLECTIWQILTVAVTYRLSYWRLVDLHKDNSL